MQTWEKTAGTADDHAYELLSYEKVNDNTYPVLYAAGVTIIAKNWVLTSKHPGELHSHSYSRLLITVTV